MQKRKYRRKKWLDYKSRKGNKRKHKRKQVINKKADSRYSEYTYYSSDNNIVVLKPPIIFSLTNNTFETMGFFMSFKKELEKKRQGTRFIIDSQAVEQVTVEALIYLIAIIQNDNINQKQHYSFSGNYPNNDDAKRIYVESGFTDYVKSNLKEFPVSSSKMRIICGTKNEPPLAKELSDFVMINLKKTKKDIQPIQKVLIELMSNVYHHAYEKHYFMAKKWYMYAEYIDDYIRCVFVDTGKGIAHTARKNFGESIRAFWGFNVDDSKIIKSIFDGEFRTATNEKHRGNGLRTVRENVEADIFCEFEVISGRGKCIIPKGNSSKDIIAMSYKNYIYGTLYQFVIR